MGYLLHRMTTGGIVTEHFASATDALARMSETANENPLVVTDEGTDLDMDELEALALKEN
ncbi:hypothetical protein LRS10_09340 [Phenylobacterium sp. J426]|uniref:hypothetical protein n=1 Tax=Phenylobacterium sp. J426 TaxID=2898439 RepID=UPI002150CE6F|nr:hypothetical protein [Phenylobacterium sp. J426]MCR5874346.1 hypothetical protein [Phenylobacterium sp. J426]